MRVGQVRIMLVQCKAVWAMGNMHHETGKSRTCAEAAGNRAACECHACASAAACNGRKPHNLGVMC